tara:strand:- start:27530 stop:27847 length:318 start_codon:yes stop_codon:yes gene_type:complete
MGPMGSSPSGNSFVALLGVGESGLGGAGGVVLCAVGEGVVDATAGRFVDGDEDGDGDGSITIRVMLVGLGQVRVLRRKGSLMSVRMLVAGHERSVFDAISSKLGR